MILPTTIAQVITQLELIVEESAQRNEREGYFAALYLRVTKAVKQKIDNNYFDDNARMERLDVIFANRYLTAYDQYKNNLPCSTSWQVAFDTCTHWQPLVLHHLFVGMNAHIGLDLGLAAATVCPGQEINSLHADFNKINIVLAGLVDKVEDEIEEMLPLLKPIDKLAGRLDEKIAVFSMNIARDAAWQTALDYAKQMTAEEKEKFVDTRDTKVAAFGEKITQPRFLLRVLIAFLHLFEHGSVKRKIKILNEGNKRMKKQPDYRPEQLLPQS